ncbi:ABC transporter permease [Streptomyces sp. RKAG293]|uniref:ABC transporter permease n=1 Tax=Streptomyces sp. RKAG293 TaxID=2893403 RepID=UPI002034A622|nr:ABC transporter permease [Streptomyces sp. RKAG293]MCM2423563.1 ABC transporter permease [Streptomyces sp. RKAG293]
MTAFRSLARAQLLGWSRDRAAVFFTVLFPLLFLLLFGSLFKGASAPHITLLQSGPVALFDSMTPDQRAQLNEEVTLVRDDDQAGALEKVRNGDDDGLVAQGPDGRLVLRYSVADATRAATVQGVVNGIVQQANQEASHAPPTYVLQASQVEDLSTKPIQYLTPGLLGWAIATSGTFTAALTLVVWRKKFILRRLRLAPVRLPAVVAAPVAVTLLVALVQTAVFLGVATLPYYGLKLTGQWWIALPLVLSGSLAFMSIGLLVGSWAKTEQTATAAAQLIVLPMAFLSGSFFPLDSAPGWLKTVSTVLPLHHLSTAMQNVLTRGGGWGDALPTIGGLLLFTAVLTLLAVRLFRWDDA